MLKRLKFSTLAAVFAVIFSLSAMFFVLTGCGNETVNSGSTSVEDDINSGNSGNNSGEIDDESDSELESESDSSDSEIESDSDSSDSENESDSEIESESGSSDSENESDSESESIIDDESGNHFYNGKEVEDREYTSAELKEIFGDDYNMFINHEEFWCGDEGYAYFICENCGKKVILYVRDRHQFGNPVVTVDSGEQTVTVTLTCKVCGDKLIFEHIGERDDIEANCIVEGKDRIVYSYEVYDEKFEGEKVLRTYDKEYTVHVHGEYILYLDTEEVYRKAELEEMFADGGLTILANEMNCTDITGNAVFKCDLCGKSWVLNVIDYDKAKYVKFSNGNKILAFQKYSFRMCDELLNNDIFKLVDESSRDPFVSDRFKQTVEDNHLTGFKFELVWDSGE